MIGPKYKTFTNETPKVSQILGTSESRSVHIEYDECKDNIINYCFEMTTNDSSNRNL